MDRAVTMLERLGDHSLSDRVADRIRTAIQAGVYPPGTKLVERTIAAQLGVSHIPVREALARLADEGIVLRIPRRGAWVAELTPVGLAEISSLRIVLEGFVVRRAQERRTPAAEERLRSIAGRMLDAADAGSVDALVALDQEFHGLLWELSDHSLLNEVAAQVRGRVAAFLRAATRSLPADELRAHAKTHVDIVDAIASGDPEQAQAEMARHIQVAASRIERSLAKAAEPAP
jgi:DNA-binding GntR family transcriptional regulator